MVANANRAFVGDTKGLKCTQHQCSGFLQDRCHYLLIKDRRMLTKVKRPGLPTWHFCNLRSASSIELERRQCQCNGCLLQGIEPLPSGERSENGDREEETKASIPASSVKTTEGHSDTAWLSACPVKNTPIIYFLIFQLLHWLRTMSGCFTVNHTVAANPLYYLKLVRSPLWNLRHKGRGRVADKGWYEATLSGLLWLVRADLVSAAIFAWSGWRHLVGSPAILESYWLN